MSTTTIPVLSLQDGLKTWNANRAKPFAFYFNKTNNLLKLISQRFNIYSSKIIIKQEQWFMFTLKMKRTKIQIMVKGFGANQKVIIRKG